MLETRKELPVYQFKDDILDAIQKNNIVIIRGSTGCGKTTQVYFLNFCTHFYFSFVLLKLYNIHLSINS